MKLLLVKITVLNVLLSTSSYFYIKAYISFKLIFIYFKPIFQYLSDERLRRTYRNPTG